MGLLATDPAKKRRPYKTIIIPKGVIKPDQNNVIEIPVHLDTNNSLVVKGATDSKSCLSVEPYYSSSAYDLQASPAVETTASTSTAQPIQIIAPITPVASISSAIRVPPTFHTIGQQTYPLPYQPLLCSTYGHSNYRYFRPHYDFLKQSTIYENDNILLKKLLDDKINKILKPIVSKSWSDDEDEEEIKRKPSCCRLTSRCSKDHFCPRRHYCWRDSAFDDFIEPRSCYRNCNSPKNIRIKVKPSYNQIPCPKHDKKKPVVVIKGDLIMQKKDSDDKNKKKKKRDEEKKYIKICPKNTSCKKSKNKWINDDDSSSDSDFEEFVRGIGRSDRSSDIDLNKAIYFKGIR